LTGGKENEVVKKEEERIGRNQRETKWQQTKKGKERHSDKNIEKNKEKK
jgi:hypothetical protein